MSSARARLLSLTTAVALAAGGLALAPPPAHAATPKTVGYTCLGSIADPLTTVLDPLHLLPDTTIPFGSQPVGLVIDQLGTVTVPVGQALEPITGTLGLAGNDGLIAKLTGLLGSPVTGLLGGLNVGAATLAGVLGSGTDATALPINLNSVTGALSLPLPTPTALGDLPVSLPMGFTLPLSTSLLGLTSTLTCTIDDATTALLGQVRVVAASDPVYGTEPVGGGLTGAGAVTQSLPAGSNPCTVALPKVGTKRTALKLTLAKKKVKRTAHAKLGAKATYKLGGRKKKASGYALVCDGTKALGLAILKRGSFKVMLPRLVPGRHKLLVRYVGGGKAEPASKRITLTVRR